MAFFPKASSSRQGASQNVALTGTSAASTSFGSETYQIRVFVADLTGAPTSVRIRIGDGSPTATTTDSAISTTVAEYFTVTPGQKIAAILIGGTTPTANLSVTEMS